LADAWQIKIRPAKNSFRITKKAPWGAFFDLAAERD
jgi:hypothetical protein